ncbi:hypothetical protein CRE_02486 [Caenorhabditis remanei]|uniref:Uncharacterized protein n=1 Tax=Caenorhabditis remanei TaxID=31234 RepID=E3MWS8_CAERE|nr:hypothetical protein CRE_02486 [Caenorhabditis remanei]
MSSTAELQIINNATLLINDFLNTGRFSFDHLSTRLPVITELGSFIGTLQNEVPKEPRIREAFLNQEDLMCQLTDKMNRNWDVLKWTMSGNSMFAEVAQEAGTVTNFMLDAIRHPCGHSIGLFGDACNKMSPLMNGYKLITLLEQDSTNPLKVAMNADDYKRTDTFEKWRGILDGAMTHLLFLETFSIGMFWQQNMYGPENLKRKIERMNAKFDYARDEYKINYWPDTVQQMLFKVQNQNQSYGNLEKAKKIQTILRQVLTDDVFYIIVYDSCQGNSFHCNDNQHITSSCQDGSNIVIYRSKEWGNAEKGDVEKMKEDVEKCKEKAKEWIMRLGDLPKWIMTNHVKNSAFVGLIREDNNVQILSAGNFYQKSTGPGHWTNISLGNAEEKYFLIAGYK